MTLDHRLIDLLVCPVCKGPLQAQRDADNRLVELQCPADKLGFAVRDGIPVMLEHEARSLDVPAEAASKPD
jgi:hypothetical protein